MMVWITDYSGDLKSGLVLILNCRKEVGLKKGRISNEIWNPEAQPSGKMATILIKKHLKSGQKHPNFDISSMCDIYLTSCRTRQAWDMFQGLCKKRKEGRKKERKKQAMIPLQGIADDSLLAFFNCVHCFFYCLIMKMYLLTSSLIRFINLRHLR